MLAEAARAELQAIVGPTYVQDGLAQRIAYSYDGTFQQFVGFLRTDDRFFFDRAEDLLVAYRDICKRVDPELPKLFATLPRLPYGVAAVPSYAEKSQTTAYYEPGSPSAGRPGRFFANTYDLRARPLAKPFQCGRGALGDPKLEHLAPAAQRLAHRVAPVNDLPRHESGTSSKPSAEPCTVQLWELSKPL